MAGHSLLLMGVIATLISYIIALCIHRLCFSRLSHIPGPKLAALTYYYQSYYDLWPYSGRFVWQTRELHKQYGPIVRIGPDEVHIDDPDYYTEIYTSHSRRRDKSRLWFWMTENTKAAAWMHASVFMTIPHGQHRTRRIPLNPFFSKKVVQELEPRIKDKVEQAKRRILEYASSAELLDLINLCTGLTLDVISEYSFGESIGALNIPDFGKQWNYVLLNANKSHPAGRAFPIILNSVNSWPQWLTEKSPELQSLLVWSKLIRDLTQRTLDRAMAGSVEGKPAGSIAGDRNVLRTLFLSDTLPSEDRRIERVAGEGLVIVGAGTETTGRTLALTLYHILANPAIYKRLLEELRTVMPNGDSPLPAGTVLEKLPYLTAVISEGLRTSHGTAGRLVRIAPDEDLQYGKYKIPRGATFSQSQYIYHTNEKNFPDPLTFNPERFLGPDAARAVKNFAPFGKGARSCVGMNLAYSELYHTVAALISGVKMELVDTTERDATIVSEFLVGMLPSDSKGIRVRVLGEQ